MTLLINMNKINKSNKMAINLTKKSLRQIIITMKIKTKSNKNKPVLIFSSTATANLAYNAENYRKNKIFRRIWISKMIYKQKTI